MKRRRRLFTAWRMQIVAAMAYGGQVIPPQSTVRPKQSVAGIYGTNDFRIGYYCRQDGLNCVWLVNPEGEYEGTATQRDISKGFEILTQSTETDLYGDTKRQLQPLATSA